MLPLLTSVRIVLEAGRLQDLPHVAYDINRFLDRTHSWTIIGAARIGSVHLLARLQMLQQCGGLADFQDALVIQDAIHEAASAGHTRVLDWLMDAQPKQPNGNQAQLLLLAAAARLVEAAAANGHVSVLQWVQQRLPSIDFLDPSTAITCATTSGSSSKADTIFALAMETAAMHHHLDLIEWLHKYQEQEAHSDTTTPRSAVIQLTGVAMEGHLDVLQWFHRHRAHDLSSGRLLDGAAARGALEMVQWLHEMHHDSCASCSGATIGRTAANGHLDVVQWMLANRSDVFPSHALAEITRNGHFHVLRWLYDHPQCRELFTNGATNCLGDAAEGGRLVIVQWLLALQPHVPAWRAIDRAAANGHLDVLHWLHTYRTDTCCARAMDLAAANGHLAVVKFLHENRTEGCTQDAMDAAASRGHLEIVQFLHSNRGEGCMTRAMDNAAWHNHMKMVQFLHTNRHEGCTTQAMDCAARNGNLEMLMYLHTNRREGCSGKALAMESKSLRCVKWVLTQYPHFCEKPHALQEVITHSASKIRGIRHITQYLRGVLNHLSRKKEQQQQRPIVTAAGRRPRKRIKVEEND